MLLHVVDASHPNSAAQIAAVRVVLQEIGASDRPQLIAFNKADRISADDRKRLAATPGAVVIAAATGEGMEALLERISAVAAHKDRSMDVLIPYNRGELVQLAHEHGHVLAEEHTAEGTRLTFVAPGEVAARFAEFVKVESA
ncbi:hypothetical protein EG835_13955 [bacterium]|nr:hypothetical protein [bacterium]